MEGFIIAYFMLFPVFLVVGGIIECPPVKRWLDRLAKDLPMFRNS